MVRSRLRILPPLVLVRSPTAPNVSSRVPLGRLRRKWFSGQQRQAMVNPTLVVKGMASYMARPGLILKNSR